MTTIILTIIGILLAAAAALMVIFYGGDAFGNGSTKARAVELINLADNVGTAQAMFRAEHGRFANSLDELAENGKYLKERPSSDGLALEIGSDSGAGYAEFYAMNVYGDVCPQINKLRKIPDMTVVPAATDPTSPRMGCVRVTDLSGPSWYFFARA